MISVLVVGAGFAGSVVARELAVAGISVHVIDKRLHIAGNAYDTVNKYGERLHLYGPHLIHADQGSPAVAWLSSFTEWIPYEHRVRALLPDGRTTPLPVNRTTLEDVYGIKLSSDAEARNLLEREIVTSEIRNADDFFLSSVGPRLADLFFRPYTRKMWGLDATQIEPSVGARLPVRLNRDDRYFTDTFQAMPAGGYTAMFENILDHKNIRVSLGCPYEHSMYDHYDHIFTSAPIDSYYGYHLGRLPYRSIIFETHLRDESQEAATINYTDSGMYTRSTQWDLIVNSGRRRDGLHTVTREVPCAPEENNNECYYPVRNSMSKALYRRYEQLAASDKKITFIGRSGLFVYIDMMPCVTSHLEIARRFLAAQKSI